MTSIGKDRIRDGDESIIEGRWECDVPSPSLLGMQASSNHADDACHENADTARNTDPGHVIQSSREAGGESEERIDA